MPTQAATPCGPYRVGLREYPRLYQRDASGGFIGVDKEFFEMLAQRSGCRLEIQLESQPRIWQFLKRGELDLASWVIPSPERDLLVTVIPLIQSRPMTVTWRDGGPQTEAGFLADPALNAVTVRKSLYGAGYDELMQRLREQGRLSEAPDFETALRAFSARRSALLIAYPWGLLDQSPQWFSQVQLSDWHAGGPSVSSGLAISRSTVSAADRQRLEDAVRAMHRDGSLRRILDRYLPPEMVQHLAPGR
ncbi:MAG TPA: transporter substrate-binding domain-containing protein [Burkholderiaceae bacterium]|jgi:polar amino acid transport system substrate-binding protein